MHLIGSEKEQIMTKRRYGLLMSVVLAGAALAGTGCDTADAAPREHREAPSGPTTAVEQVSGARARELVEAGASLVDVRTPGEFASGHPEAAVNIPVNQVGARLSEIDRSRPVVVYCQSGRRSAAAAEVLAAAGYQVHDMGAVASW